MALDSVWEKLLRPDLEILQLFDPPYRHSQTDPGYIKGYPPGVRENAGQYTHATVWAAWAFALAGQNKRSSDLVRFLNPINHALDPGGVQTYRVEPYVLAADTCSQSPFEGRGGWTWYTGSAAWYFRLLSEVIFGIKKVGDTLSFDPHPPPDWERFEVEYRFGSAVYEILFKRVAESQGVQGVCLNSARLSDGVVQLSKSAGRHSVEVVFSSTEGVV
jgi:cellobiose phosphorylase